MKFKLFLKQQYIFIILINLYIGKQFCFNENNICMLKAIILPNIVNMIPIKLYLYVTKMQVERNYTSTCIINMILK